MSPTLLGVDGCADGWLVVQMSRESTRAAIHGSFEELLKATPADAFVAIDVPIGLPEAGARRCDVEARKILSPRRASSVFPAPVRAALGAVCYAEACERHRKADGRALSKQCYAIVPKIQEVDETLRRLQDPQSQVREIHPELSFAMWNGGVPMMNKKRSLEGRRERQALIDDYWPGMRRVLTAKLPRGGWAIDDLDDALAALWTAERIAQGRAVRIPTAPDVDYVGLKMEMWV